MKKTIFIAIIFWLSAYQSAAFCATYYVDISVTDTNVASPTPDFSTYNHETFNTGTGSSLVFKNVADLNACTFIGGDRILFRKGQTWVNQLNIPSSGASGNNIIFGSYGTGNLPLLYSIFGNAKNYITISNIEVIGNIIANGTGWKIKNVKDSYNNGTVFTLNGTNNNASGFDPIIALSSGGACLWTFGDGTTSTSQNPGNKDYGTAKPRRFACIVNDVSKITSVDWNTDDTTGPLPDLSKCTGLVTWVSATNQHTGPLPDLSKCTVLVTWVSATNQHTGPLPDLSKCTGLVTWATYGNQHTGINFTSLPASITSFSVQGNLLTQSDVSNILIYLDAAGGSGARTCNVGGTGNAAPNAAGITAKNNLIAKGWTVTTN